MSTSPDVRLSDEIGRRVLDPDGTPLGRVADLSARMGPATPPVFRLLVRDGRGSAYLLPARAVARGRLDLRVRAGTAVAACEVDPTQLRLEDGELLLGRDVLDTQVVDLRGRHLSRVSDVLLREHGDDLEVAAVDLGMAGLFRRLGLPRWRPRGLEVEWEHVHLTSPRGHLVQLTTDAAAFRRLDPHGLAELLTRLSTSRAIDVLRAIEPSRAAAALHHSHPRTGRRIVGAMNNDEREDLAAGAEEAHRNTVEHLGRHAGPLQRRRYRRTEGWRLHRPPGGEP